MNLPKACNNIFVDFFCMCVFFCRTDLYSTSPFQGEELCLYNANCILWKLNFISNDVSVKTLHTKENLFKKILKTFKSDQSNADIYHSNDGKIPKVHWFSHVELSWIESHF